MHFGILGGGERGRKTLPGQPTTCQGGDGNDGAAKEKSEKRVAHRGGAKPHRKKRSKRIGGGKINRKRKRPPLPHDPILKEKKTSFAHMDWERKKISHNRRKKKKKEIVHICGGKGPFSGKKRKTR